MGTGHAAMAGGRHAADQRVDAEMQQAGTDADDVDQRIQRPHLMELHLLGRMAVHRRLRRRQQGEHRQHLVAQGLRQRRLGQLAPQQLPGAMARLGLQGHHRQVQSPQSGTAALLQIEAIKIGQTQGRQGLVDHRWRQTQIQQGRQQHVARQTGGTVDQGEGHAAGLGSVGLG